MFSILLMQVNWKNKESKIIRKKRFIFQHEDDIVLIQLQPTFCCVL